jgi:hypothetical protein
VSDQLAITARMPPAPGDQLGDIVSGDVRDQNILTEKFNQIADLSLRIPGAGMVLPMRR